MLIYLRSWLKVCLLCIIAVFVEVAYLFARQKEPYAIVLMYHSVESSGWKYSVTPRMFEKQMAYLKKHYSVVSLPDIVAFVLEKKELPAKTIAVTIDDGYRDTYEVVFPVLKKYSLPATVFLTSDLKERSELGSFERLNEEQIKEMYDSGLVTFEVHGREHKNLTKLDVNSKEFDDEVMGCREDIKRVTGYESRMIAYASGNRSERVQQKLRELGFAAGFCITEGVVRNGDDPLALRRVQIDNTMPWTLFRLRLSPAIQSYWRMIKTLRS